MYYLFFQSKIYQINHFNVVTFTKSARMTYLEILRATINGYKV